MIRRLYVALWGVVFFCIGSVAILALLPDGDKKANSQAAHQAGKTYGLPLIFGSFALAGVLGALGALPGTRQQREPIDDLASNGPSAFDPPVSPSALSPSRHGAFWWAAQVASAPLRVVGLLLLIILLPGLFYLWQLPRLAKDGQVDLSLLTLRVLDGNGKMAPFLPLGYQDGVVAGVVELRSKTDLVDDSLFLLTYSYYTIRTTSVKSEPTPEGKVKHSVSYSNGRTVTATGTTPHLTVDRAELAKARRAVRELFPFRKERREVLEWGEALFRAAWLWQYGSTVVNRPTVEPAGGTEDEQYWLAWKVLRGEGLAADEELPRLTELFDQAFPGPEDREAALTWARDWYDRRAREFQTYQERARAAVEGVKTTEGAWRKSPFVNAQVAELKRVLPPAGDWTYRWLVYRYFGLTAPSREAARKAWLSRFPDDAAARVEAYGEKILEERRAANEPLPPVPETLPLVCAVERLVGSDPYGQRCRDLLANAFPGERSRIGLGLATTTLNPNDDLAYLVATPDALGLSPVNSGSLRQRCLNLLSLGSVVAFVALCFSTVLSWILKPLLIQGQARRLWEKHEASRGKESLWRMALGIVAAAAVAAATAPLALPEQVSLQVSSPIDLFLGALAATTLGGLLIATCRRLFALLLVACRIDVAATWFDEVLGILAGAFVLHHFGSAWPSIVAAALADVIPGVFGYLVARLRRQREEPREVLAPVKRPSRPAVLYQLR